MSKKIIILLVVVAAVLFVVFGTLQTLGFVLDGAYIVKGASLDVTAVPSGTLIYIDEKKRGVTDDDGTTHINGITRGVHTIISAHPLSWPWIENITVDSLETYTISPLIIAREPHGILLDANDTTTEEQRALADTVMIPTGTAPRLSDDQTGLLWFDGSTIMVRVGGVDTALLRPRGEVRALAWYANRTDAIIVAAGERVFVLGTNTETPQNFLPVYEGIEPTFVHDTINTQSLIIKDGERVMLLNLSIN